MTTVDWASGEWLNPPPKFEVDDAGLAVTSGHESDFWNHTGYDFVHDNGHALLVPFGPNTAMEVEFSADWTHPFDQAGLFVYANADNWVKAGVEFADGVLGVGAVVTAVNSDWSVGHVPEWSGKPIRVRVSRTANSVTVRARAGEEPWRLVRLAPIAADLEWHAGPLVASPSRAGLVVRFNSWEILEADSALHG
jgi:uncharacterized protein